MNGKLPDTMRAMVLTKARTALELRTLPLPRPAKDQVLIRVIACGICRTDLHVVDGELDNPKLPLIPGHEIVGRVVTLGDAAQALTAGQLVGVPWLGYTCGTCKYCRSGRENLCDNPLFTGYTLDGGYAEYTVAFSGYCFPLTEDYGSPASAPLLCAGLIGYRSYRMIDPKAERIGLYGFGAAAHILIQLGRYQGKKVYAFTRDGDLAGQDFARLMGAHWAGDSSAMPPVPLDASILFAPVGALVPLALQATDKGGSVICGGIHMSDIPAFPYRLLWGERIVRSVANLTRKDGREFLDLAPRVPIRTETTTFPLEQANEALTELRSGRIKGAAALLMSIFLLLSLGFSSCRKSNSPTNRLPAETHAGLNTMGCLINGELFIPQEPALASHPYAIASLMHQSPFSLWLSWSDEPQDCGRTAVDIRLDSVALAQGATYPLGTQPLSNNDTSHAEWATFTEDPCNSLPAPYSTTAQITGQATITWFDPVKGIVAGTFYFDAVDGNGDTVQVRQGRFDMSTK